MTEKITRINPDGLHEPPGYHHVTVVAAGRTAHLAGQCPVGTDGDVVGVGDIDAQIDQVVANSLVALRAAGSGPEDVIRSVIYVVSDDRGVLGHAWDRLVGSALGPAVHHGEHPAGDRPAWLFRSTHRDRSHRRPVGIRGPMRSPLVTHCHNVCPI